MINEACHEENIPVINHNNINPKRHLDHSKLHFNNYGKSVFVKNIRNFLSNLIWRHGRDNSEYMQNSLSLSISLQNSLDISKSLNIFENDLNQMNKIKMQHFEHFNTSIAGHLNINSIRNKFEMIVETITNFDIILISKSKIDSTFPNKQFKINGYKLFRLDRNKLGKGLILYLNRDTMSVFKQSSSQPAFTCLKSTIETLEQGVKYVQS